MTTNRKRMRGNFGFFGRLLPEVPRQRPYIHTPVFMDPASLYEYQMLSRTMARLLQQKSIVEGDIKTLQEMQATADSDPQAFVQTLMSGMLPPFPERQRVLHVPPLTFEHFVDIPADYHNPTQHKLCE